MGNVSVNYDNSGAGDLADKYRFLQLDHHPL